MPRVRVVSLEMNTIGDESGQDRDRDASAHSSHPVLAEHMTADSAWEYQMMVEIALESPQDIRWFHRDASRLSGLPKVPLGPTSHHVCCVEFVGLEIMGDTGAQYPVSSGEVYAKRGTRDREQAGYHFAHISPPFPASSYYTSSQFRCQRCQREVVALWVPYLGARALSGAASHARVPVPEIRRHTDRA